MKGVGDVGDAGIPALAASAALVVVVGRASPSGAGYRGSGKLAAIDCVVYTVGRKTDGKIVGNVFNVIQNDLLFFCWKPMAYGGRLAANLHDFVKVGYILEVAAIKPPEMPGLIASKIV